MLATSSKARRSVCVRQKRTPAPRREASSPRSIKRVSNSTRAIATASSFAAVDESGVNGWLALVQSCTGSESSSSSSKPASVTNSLMIRNKPPPRLKASSNRLNPAEAICCVFEVVPVILLLGPLGTGLLVTAGVVGAKKSSCGCSI